MWERHPTSDNWKFEHTSSPTKPRILYRHAEDKDRSHHAHKRICNQNKAQQLIFQAVTDNKLQIESECISTKNNSMKTSTKQTQLHPIKIYTKQGLRSEYELSDKVQSKLPGFQKMTQVFDVEEDGEQLIPLTKGSVQMQQSMKDADGNAINNATINNSSARNIYELSRTWSLSVFLLKTTYGPLLRHLIQTNEQYNSTSWKSRNF